ncbi:MAG: PAS domain S-box protein [candidate division Zixibacteria bacterium]|nr:PAS domain S-box protein [candidate division Zixibacteria bacterium]
MTSSRFGIISRLGNLIIVQVLFIFTALALILFVPKSDNDLDGRIASLEGKLIEIGRHTAGSVSFDQFPVEAEDYPYENLDLLLDSLKLVDQAAIIRVCGNHNLEIKYAYSQSDASTDEFVDDRDISSYSSYPMLRLMASSADELSSQVVMDTDDLVYYQRLAVDSAGMPILLVIAVKHGLTVSSQSYLQDAVLFLFLCSTLVSLLTVWFLLNKFKLPLDRIIAGFEETADGKLHNLNELTTDLQLGKLTCAYNAMTLKLWDNRKQLDDYCTRLGQANVELRESKSFLMTLVDSTPLSIIVTNLDGEILMINQKAGDVFGYKTDEIAGRPLSTLISEDSVQSVSDTAIGDQLNFEAICRCHDGTEFPGYIISSHVAAEGDRPSVRLYVCRNITDSKDFQKMMIRLDRYYSRGEMASDIAHEINNYLAVLLGNVELMPMYLKNGKMDKVEKKLEVMKNALESIARFSDGLLDSGVDVVRLELAPINQIVENVIAFLKPQNKFDVVDVDKELSAEISVLRVDSGQIQQLLVNLIYNAAEAVSANEGEKHIQVVTSPAEFDGTPGVQIRVCDNGPGVVKNKEKLLFNTRFTTKERGHGIGLITCQRIVDNHSGNITYEAQDGAVFSVFLPEVKETEEPVETYSDATGQPV